METGASSYDVDEDIEDLHSSVKRLKHVSKAIQEETSITGKILETLVCLFVEYGGLVDSHHDTTVVCRVGNEYGDSKSNVKAYNEEIR
jgi:predicted HAD superfamily Cof-like phosphohydrolase